MSRYSYNSPIGNLLIISDQKGIESLSISDVKAEERDSFID